MEPPDSNATLEDLRAKVEAHVSQQTGAPARVLAIAPLPGGACQDNFRVDLRIAAGELAGDRRMVLRCDAPRALPGSIDRRAEHDIIRAAAASGVRTPVARWLARDVLRPGCWGYFLDWVEGEAIGRRVVRNPELANARRTLPAELGRQLALIHRVTPSTHPDLLPAPGNPVASALRFVRRIMSTMREARPALELAVLWLEANPPRGRDVTLTHGDFRTGNFMVSPEGLTGILDWEFAHFGTPHEDLAWISVRDWRFSELALPIGGFGHREPFYEAYEQASGRAVDRRDILYWEVFGNVRWAAGAALQGERYLGGDRRDLELVAIARRAVEMEFEALRLIDEGG